MEALFFLDLVHHSIVRDVRLMSGNAALGLLVSITKTLAMVAAFYAVYAFIGVRTAVIRGDVVLFLVSGIMLFLLHNAVITRTIAAGSSTAPIMMHAPMSPALLILARTLAETYMFLLTALVIFAGLYFVRDRFEIFDPVGLILPFLLAWASGVTIGLMFLMMKPFAPNAMDIVSRFYTRANMVTSGKFFVANTIPAALLPAFSWNPLFHAIDQTRGAMFVNYVPKNSSLDYVIYFVLIGSLIGMMGEFWVRRNVSNSQSATQ